MSTDEVRVVDQPDQEFHRRILAVLFCFYGCAHLVVVSFTWLIILALAKEGYFGLRELKTFGFLGVILLIVVTSLLSTYALLRQRRWASGILYLTCLMIFIGNAIVLSHVFWPRLSVNRMIFGVLYGGGSLAICIYGLWFAITRANLNDTNPRD